MLYQLNYWRMYERLASLFVHGVLTAPGAILLDLHAIRGVGLVLVRRVVTTLALSAGKCNESTHVSFYLQIPYLTGTVVKIIICITFLSMRYASPRYICRSVTQPLHGCRIDTKTRLPRRGTGLMESTARVAKSYSMMVLTIPEPTVWPPSRIAKRRPSSIAIG